MDLVSFNIALDVCSCTICLIIAVLRMVMRVFDEEGRVDSDAYNAMCLSIAAYSACDALIRARTGMTPTVYIAAAVMATSVLLFYRGLIRLSLQGLETFGVSLALKVFPVLSVAVGVLAPSIATTGVISTCGLLLVLVGALPLRERAIEQGQGAHARADAALSQIQPHFMHNTLAAIRYLARREPARAGEMLDEFSAYLRGNMESLTQVGAIPFEDELGHTRKYLELEQLRLGDRLAVSYDIHVAGFSLPPLSLQTLAENAVRHGISKRPEGGSLAIRTYEDEQGYVVEVSDDGVGFDTECLPDDGRRHVGLESTKLRLASMCGGALSMNSVPGKGTFARMYLPRTQRGKRSLDKLRKGGAAS